MEQEDVLNQFGPISSKLQESINRRFGLQFQKYIWDGLPISSPWYTNAEDIANRISNEEPDVFKKALKIIFETLINENVSLKNRVTELENRLNSEIISILEEHENRIEALESSQSQGE